MVQRWNNIFQCYDQGIVEQDIVTEQDQDIAE